MSNLIQFSIDGVVVARPGMDATDPNLPDADKVFDSAWAFGSNVVQMGFVGPADETRPAIPQSPLYTDAANGTHVRVHFPQQDFVPAVTVNHVPFYDLRDNTSPNTQPKAMAGILHSDSNWGSRFEIDLGLITNSYFDIPTSGPDVDFGGNQVSVRMVDPNDHSPIGGLQRWVYAGYFYVVWSF